MSDLGPPKVDVDVLMDRIHREMRGRRSRIPSSVPSGSTGEHDWTPLVGGSLSEAIAAAQMHAEVGAELPPMHRMQGWRRSLATAFGKMVLRISQVFTRDQRAFNAAIISSLRLIDASVSGLTEGLRQARSDLAGLRDTVTRLESAIRSRQEHKD